MELIRRSHPTSVLVGKWVENYVRTIELHDPALSEYYSSHDDLEWLIQESVYHHC